VVVSALDLWIGKLFFDSGRKTYTKIKSITNSNAEKNAGIFLSKVLRNPPNNGPTINPIPLAVPMYPRFLALHYGER
jgi:hypothetical protein